MHDRGYRKRHLYQYIEYTNCSATQQEFQEQLNMVVSRGQRRNSRSNSPTKSMGEQSDKKSLPSQINLESVEERLDTFSPDKSTK